MELQRFDPKAIIEISGHAFHGIDDIEKAVEVETRVSNSIGPRYINRIDPEKPVAGIHVLKVFQPYPCFDASDLMYENRRYCNYFFSKEPFSDERINCIADSKWRNNYCLLSGDMDENLTPAIYYGGSSWDDVIAAF